MIKIYNRLKRVFSFLKPVTKSNVEYCPGDVIISNDCVVDSCTFGRYNKINKGSYLYKVNYGDYTYSAINVTMMNCNIGKFCSIAQGVCIGLGIHPLANYVSTHPSLYSINKQCGFTFSDEQYFKEMGEVTIGNDVWIGVNSIILDDITIGDGAVIAANSVVSTNVPPYAIYGGTPAKLIRYRFPEKTKIFLENFKWWDKDTEWIQNNFKDFHNIESFIKKYYDNC